MYKKSKYDKLPDDKVITLVRQGGRPYEEASEYLFYEFLGYIPKVKSELDLSKEDADDAYADALVKLLRQIKTATFRGESKISTYFFRIYKNKAVDVLRHNTSNKILDTRELSPYDAREKDLLDLITSKEEAKVLVSQINQLGESCRSILLDWGYYGYSMEEIAQRAQLASPESARSMKYKCLKKLKKLISQQA